MKQQLVFLPTSLCAADTTESESDLKELFQTCELSLTVRSKLMQLPTLLRKWKRDKWMKLLFSRTSRHFRIENLVVGLPCSVQDSLVNHSAVQVNAKQQKTQDTCTRGSQMELQLCDHDMSSSKMLKESSQLKQETENRYLNMSSETWKKEVTRVRGEYSVRLKSVHHTKENECSSWGTPKELDSRTQRQLTNGENVSHTTGVKYGIFLEQQVTQLYPNWATPQGRDHYSAESKEKWEARAKLQAEKGVNLHLPLNTQCQHIMEEERNTQQDHTNNNTIGKNREQLNPAWVEQLMGLPTGWTDLGSWVTE